MPKARKVISKLDSFDPNDILIQNEGLRATEENLKEDLHKYVVRGSWPIIEHEIYPSFPKGEDHLVNLNIPIRDFQWHGIDRHIRKLDISKSKWIRYWIFYGLQYEQEHYFKKNKERKGN